MKYYFYNPKQEPGNATCHAGLYRKAESLHYNRPPGNLPAPLLQTGIVSIPGKPHPTWYRLTYPFDRQRPPDFSLMQARIVFFMSFIFSHLKPRSHPFSRHIRQVVKPPGFCHFIRHMFSKSQLTFCQPVGLCTTLNLYHRLFRLRTKRMPRDGIIPPAGKTVISLTHPAEALLRENILRVRFLFLWRQAKELLMQTKAGMKQLSFRKGAFNLLNFNTMNVLIE